MPETTGEVEPKSLDIIGAKETDSLGTDKWREYLDRNKLLEAWTPVEGSPYQRFQKYKTIDVIGNLASRIKPRCSQGEITSEEGIRNLIGSGNTGKDTAVILDSGGPHSVAMAVTLAEIGYQPVVMLNETLIAEGNMKAQEQLATLLYFSERISQLKTQGVIKPDAPPVFILDCHRDDDITGKGGEYNFTNKDLPSAEELKKQCIAKVVYLNEGDQEGKINDDFQSIERVWKDLRPLAEEWEASGIKMLYTGVAPWKERGQGIMGNPLQEYTTIKRGTKFDEMFKADNDALKKIREGLRPSDRK